MAFRQLMSDLSFATPPDRGMAEVKLRLWEKTLEDAKEELRNRELDNQAYERGCASIDALITKSDAEAHSIGALKTYRYIGETQARALLSASYEELFPFDCSFQWSAAETERRLSQLSWLLQPVTTQRTSRLLGYYPVAIAATMMDIFGNTAGRDIGWWDSSGNRKQVLTKAMKMMQGFKNLSLSEDDALLLQACVKLFYNVTLQLPHFDVDPSVFVDLVDKTKDDFRTRVEMAKQGDNTQSNLVYVQPVDANKILRQLTVINTTMGSELSMSMMLQEKLLRFSPERTEVLPTICYASEQQKDVTQLEFCLDPLIIEVTKMMSDMSTCITNLRSDENEEVMGDFMAVCGEFWDRSRRIHFRKLFMLVIVLMEGLDVETIDNSGLVSDIVDKIDDDGNFIDKRKRRVKLNARDKLRRKKRGPCFQPRVRRKNETSSSEDEDPRPSSRTKRKSPCYENATQPPTKQSKTTIDKRKPAANHIQNVNDSDSNEEVAPVQINDKEAEQYPRRSLVLKEQQHMPKTVTNSQSFDPRFLGQHGMVYNPTNALSLAPFARIRKYAINVGSPFQGVARSVERAVQYNQIAAPPMQRGAPPFQGLAAPLEEAVQLDRRITPSVPRNISPTRDTAPGTLPCSKTSIRFDGKTSPSMPRSLPSAQPSASTAPNNSHFAEKTVSLQRHTPDSTINNPTKRSQKSVHERVVENECDTTDQKHSSHAPKVRTIAKQSTAIVGTKEKQCTNKESNLNLTREIFGEESETSPARPRKECKKAPETDIHQKQYILRRSSRIRKRRDA